VREHIALNQNYASAAQLVMHSAVYL